ncbi:dTDP-4-dehydrorhamnose reductase [Thiobacter aerophilum]|uniref:dTDP-4-dehydrorhamnose reductase n=1 Tax=Thiobacter aerophilum TaxID=3121275 RepID=A0ABV0EEG0_9BURK
MNILLIGKNGQLGWELARALSPLGRLTALSRAELDLTDAEAIRQAVRHVGPALIVNAAAYTAVDRAQQERETVFAVNAAAPRILAEEAKRLGAALIHYSTDYVFDGGKNAPYQEIDAPRPLNVYGESKLEGERAIEALAPSYLILRLSWVYGLRGGNFLRTILLLAKERDELRVVDDQIGAPTWSRLIAEASAAIVAQAHAHGGIAEFLADKGGLYHLASAGQTSWCGFAQAIIAHAPLLARRPPVVPIPSREYPLPAPRPAYSVLDSSRAARVFGVALPDWRLSLLSCLADMMP